MGPSANNRQSGSRIGGTLVGAALCIALSVVGCGERAAPEVQPRVAKKGAPTVVAKTVRKAPATTVKPAEVQPAEGTKLPPATIPAAVPPAAAPPRSLADLAEQAEARQFDLPEINEAKVAAAGIRRIQGKHLTLYTDVPAAPEVDELPHVFDLAVPQYCEYFEIDPASLAEWRLVGYLIQDKERFQGAGLYPDDLPAFINGFQRGSEFWWNEQPSAYYRRHLMLHEGTHAFMYHWLGGAGPPWYTEGMAELLGTHRWSDERLQLAYLPQNKEEVPYWGRVKIVKDEFAADRGLQLADIMRYDARAHLRNDAYGWCWAAAQFLDQHPRTRAAFRALPKAATDRTLDFSTQFLETLKPDWSDIAEDWQLFVVNIDYGYDVARAALVRKPPTELPSEGGTTTIAADRGWQSSGFRVEAGRAYRIEAAGRYQVGGDAQPWLCEPPGITLHYHRGRPLGMLLAGVSEVETSAPLTPLARPTPIGSSGDFTPEQSGVLYLSINESSAGLADNKGSLAVRVVAK